MVFRTRLWYYGWYFGPGDGGRLIVQKWILKNPRHRQPWYLYIFQSDRNISISANIRSKVCLRANPVLNHRLSSNVPRFNHLHPLSGVAWSALKSRVYIRYTVQYILLRISRLSPTLKTLNVIISSDEKSLVLCIFFSNFNFPCDWVQC